MTQVEAYEGHRTPDPSPLRTLRALKNLSAAEFARLADINRATVRRIETGVTRPQNRTARKIAAVLDCPVDLLFPSNNAEPAGNGLGEKVRDDSAHESG